MSDVEVFMAGGMTQGARESRGEPGGMIVSDSTSPGGLPPPDVVDVWFITPHNEKREWRKLWVFLSADEQERANRFRFISDRIRFTVAHAALREILAGYLAVDPTQVQYTQNAFGKPALAGHARLRFNMAHAAAYALVAVANGREVGVDVEGHRPGLDYEALARRVLSTRELEVLQSLQTIVRPAAFLRCWAQKEAFLKAVGTGLSARLDSIEVNPAPDAPAALLAIPPALGEVGRWCLFDLSMIDGYVAALAVEGRGITIRTRECPPPRGAATA